MYIQFQNTQCLTRSLTLGPLGSGPPPRLRALRPLSYATALNQPLNSPRGALGPSMPLFFFISQVMKKFKCKLITKICKPTCEQFSHLKYQLIMPDTEVLMISNKGLYALEK